MRITTTNTPRSSVTVLSVTDRKDTDVIFVIGNEDRTGSFMACVNVKTRGLWRQSFATDCTPTGDWYPVSYTAEFAPSALIQGF